MSTDSKHFPVNITFGANAGEYDMQDGSTVEDVMENPYLKEVVGYSGNKNEEVVVNGQRVDRDYVLKPNDRLEIVKKSGEKA